MPQFTPHQDDALKAVADWLKAKPGRNGTPPVFRLFGYAGTGKTTLARHIAEGVSGEVKFAAFTGKAALVMRNKGCDNASTIHSLIYRARESGVEQPSFELWDDAPASKAKLIVIDECSMVDAELGRDLMSFECPLLVLGDPAQLPPIQGGGFFTSAEPDAMLTEVHRQAQDDPIVRMSMDVREGRELDIGRYGESQVVSRTETFVTLWPKSSSGDSRMVMMLDFEAARDFTRHSPPLNSPFLRLLRRHTSLSSATGNASSMFSRCRNRVL